MECSVSGESTDTENESKHGPGGPNKGAEHDAKACLDSKLSETTNNEDNVMMLVKTIKNLVFNY